MNQQNHDDKSATITLTWAQWIDVTASLADRRDHMLAIGRDAQNAGALGHAADMRRHAAAIDATRREAKAKLDEVAEWQQEGAA